jgi:hypothetical protein
MQPSVTRAMHMHSKPLRTAYTENGGSTNSMYSASVLGADLLQVVVPKSKPAARKLGAMNWIKHCILAKCPTNRPATRVRNGGTKYGVSTGLARG